MGFQSGVLAPVEKKTTVPLPRLLQQKLSLLR